MTPRRGMCQRAPMRASIGTAIVTLAAFLPTWSAEWVVVARAETFPLFA